LRAKGDLAAALDAHRAGVVDAERVALPSVWRYRPRPTSSPKPISSSSTGKLRSSSRPLIPEERGRACTEGYTPCGGCGPCRV
jgi:hypothetical protein